MAREPIEAVQALYGAFGRGDVPGVIDLLSPDVVWEFAGPSEAYPVFGRRNGRAGALAFFQAVGENEDIREFAPERFHPSGETVVVEGRAALALKKNGARIAYDWAHIFTVRDGAICSFRGFIDTATLVDAYRG